ncbi:hypothetical protein QJS10_CPB11g02114 [Acorus calamus]|uniref:Uncharacterized protein n=1 Tax=Acorus calamus TaxID=4465 RepID=A0AAV9DU61_ACOCL|nr:hypothetical protein QJS10_CPB11g02114 [Acorus calamus]
MEEELSKLKSQISSPNASAVLVGLNGLKSLYECVDGLLCSPDTQKALLPHRKQKWVEEMLGEFIRLLDASNVMRDALLSMKECVRALESALRRRSGGVESNLESKIGAFIFSRKKAKKDINKCLVAVRQMCPHPLQDGDNLLVVIVRLLNEVRDLTIAIFHCVLLFVGQTSPKRKMSKWSLVSRSVRRSAVACEGEQLKMSEVEVVTLSLYNISNHKSSKDIVDVERLLEIQKKLEALDVNIDGLESGLEHMFRSLIQTRVSLLNTFSL